MLSCALMVLLMLLAPALLAFGLLAYELCFRVERLSSPCMQHVATCVGVTAVVAAGAVRSSTPRSGSACVSSALVLRC